MRTRTYVAAAAIICTAAAVIEGASSPTAWGPLSQHFRIVALTILLIAAVLALAAARRRRAADKAMRRPPQPSPEGIRVAMNYGLHVLDNIPKDAPQDVATALVAQAFGNAYTAGFFAGYRVREGEQVLEELNEKAQK